MTVLYRLLKLVLIDFPVVSLVISPLVGVFWYLPEPFATWCVKIVAGSAMFSFVSVFVLYPLSERLDRLLGV